MCLDLRPLRTWSNSSSGKDSQRRQSWDRVCMPQVAENAHVGANKMASSPQALVHSPATAATRSRPGCTLHVHKAKLGWTLYSEFTAGEFTACTKLHLPATGPTLYSDFYARPLFCTAPATQQNFEEGCTTNPLGCRQIARIRSYLGASFFKVLLGGRSCA